MSDEEKGTRSESGTEEATTVLQLQPVKYQLELVYLGSNRVEQVADTYTCKFDLVSEGDLNGVAPCTTMENVARNSAADDDSDLAARSRDGGGTPVEPADGTAYRVMVLDNHGTRTSESLSLLSRQSRIAGKPNFHGDSISNPAYYEWAENGKKSWLPDVKPAVPLRVIVRKLIGDSQVDMDNEDLKVVFEVKDPKEEFDQNDGQRETFLQAFFAKYNREDLDPDPGDDNALTWFKGLRNPSHGHAGLKATDILKKMTYVDTPVVREAHPNDEILPFSELSDADADGAMNAKFDLEQVDDPDAGVKVGIADVGFCPWPAGGDNYRFLLTLKEGSTDIRDTRANGGDVILLDDQRNPIEKADAVEESRWYTSPRFTMWRKIEFKLLVRANGTADADITWANITAMYRKAFVEVTSPELSFVLTKRAWRDLLVDVFSISDAAVIAQIDAANYNAELFPGFVTTGLNRATRKTRLKTFARKAIGAACTHHGIADPDADANKANQEDGNGMFVFLARTATLGGTLGSSMGDRIFWMRKPSGADGAQWATSTCAHEFGHVRSLRHSTTTSDTILFDPAGVNHRIEVFNPESNCQILDHDGDDAYACLMAYSRALNAEPCAMCALAMRFFDRIEIQKTTRYRDEITESFGPAAILHVTVSGGSARLTDVTGGTVNGARGTFTYLIATGPEGAFTRRSGAASRGRVNLTRMQKGETWTTTGPGGVSESIVDVGDWGHVKKFDLNSAGNKVVTFRWRDISASVTLNIT